MRKRKHTRKIYLCYLPGGRSVWEKPVPGVLGTARDRPSPVNNVFIFFPALNMFYRLLMGLFTLLLSLNRLARRLLTICKKTWQRANNSDSRQRKMY